MGTLLETIAITIQEDFVDPFEAALALVCRTVGLFLIDEASRTWVIEGVKPAGYGEPELLAGLALASLVTGQQPVLRRQPTEAGGWLARTQSSFPEQRVGRRFAIRGTHLPPASVPGRFTLLLDAGLAFGSGEHDSTRGCLRALEGLAHRRPRRILDLGCGSGILAMAAAKLLHRPVLATDLDHWSVRVARENSNANGLRNVVKCRLAAGWRPASRQCGPYDLIFANILARPLCAMATQTAKNLAPNGVVILAGLLNSQARMVLAAHRRAGLVLHRRLDEGAWTTLVLSKRSRRYEAR
jgi:ribosomal protein L11 methyltransferase